MNTNNRNAFCMIDYEYHDTPHMLTLGGPLDAPDVMPSGSTVAVEGRVIMGGTAHVLSRFNVPNQSTFSRGRTRELEIQFCIDRHGSGGWDYNIEGMFETKTDAYMRITEISHRLERNRYHVRPCEVMVERVDGRIV